MNKINKDTVEIEFNQISDEYIGESKVINKKEDPCDDFKTNLAVCMKNSDNNIMVCQSLRNFYENCLREQDKIIK